VPGVEEMALWHLSCTAAVMALEALKTGAISRCSRCFLLLHAAGRRLNEDLAQLNWRFGQDHLLLEVAFPEDYPEQPFTLRVVLPRCVW